MEVNIFSIFVNILDTIEDGAFKEKQRWLLVDSLWVCFSTLRPLRLCERNMREKYVRVVLYDTNVPLRRIKNISEYRRIGSTPYLEKKAQAQMSVNKELLEYCANFARMTPRVTPLPKGCIWYPRTALVPRLYGACESSPFYWRGDPRGHNSTTCANIIACIVAAEGSGPPGTTLESQNSRKIGHSGYFPWVGYDASSWCWLPKQSNVATRDHIYLLLSIFCPTYVRIARGFSCNVVPWGQLPGGSQPSAA